MTKENINKTISFAGDTKSMMYDIKRVGAVIKIWIVSQTTAVSDRAHANTVN